LCSKNIGAYQKISLEFFYYAINTYASFASAIATTAKLLLNLLKLLSLPLPQNFQQQLLTFFC
jgi:hypothetical protein